MPRFLTRTAKGSRLTIGEGDANLAAMELELGSLAGDLASATTVDLNTATGNKVNITGTTTITGFGTAAVTGCIRVVRFTGALTLTHGASAIVLPGGVNITTVAGDIMKFQHEGAGLWRCLGFLPSDRRVLASAIVLPAIYDMGDWSASTSAMDLRNGMRQKVRMTATVTTLNITAPLGLGSYQIDIRQDTVGSRLITWPASLKWPANYATADKTLSTAASSWDRLILDYDGTNYVAGLLKGLA